MLCTVTVVLNGSWRDVNGLSVYLGSILSGSALVRENDDSVQLRFQRDSPSCPVTYFLVRRTTSTCVTIRWLLKSKIMPFYLPCFAIKADGVRVGWPTAPQLGLETCTGSVNPGPGFWVPCPRLVSALFYEKGRTRSTS